jgi:general secretion pathway protein D
VKPQISEDGQVRLQVFQENSDIDPNSNGPNGPITTKQSLETNVMVEDGGIVVLGGLAKDKFGNDIQKVPGLGDIPLFGNLFKSETRRREKRQLMLFLRPVIVRDAASVESLSLDRYELMRSGQKDVQPAPSSVLGSVNEAPVLPPQKPPSTPGKSPAPLVAPVIKTKP